MSADNAPSHRCSSFRTWADTARLDLPEIVTREPSSNSSVAHELAESESRVPPWRTSPTVKSPSTRPDEPVHCSDPFNSVIRGPDSLPPVNPAIDSHPIRTRTVSAMALRTHTGRPRFTEDLEGSGRLSPVRSRSASTTACSAISRRATRAASSSWSTCCTRPRSSGSRVPSRYCSSSCSSHRGSVMRARLPSGQCEIPRTA